MSLRRREVIAGAGVAILAGCVSYEAPGSGSGGDSGSNGGEKEEGGSQQDSQGGSTSTDTEEWDSGDIDIEEPTPSPTQGPDYSRTTDDTFSIEGGSGVHMAFEFPESFILEWSVENKLSDDLDFDVFLFTEDEYQEYVDMIRGGSEHPDYISSGTVQGIRESANATATLPGGKYRLVVDNSDYGDAGDFGEESTRRVRMATRTRKA